MQYLLDSNFLVALIDEADVHHDRATRLLEKISEADSDFFVSDVLINEVTSVFAKRCEQKKKEKQFPSLVRKFQTALRGYPILCLYELVPKHLGPIIELMVRHQARFNFHDALLITFLEQLPEVHLVSFDQDFKDVELLQVVH